jgi:hypothetical protein
MEGIHNPIPTETIVSLAHSQDPQAKTDVGSGYLN